MGTRPQKWGLLGLLIALLSGLTGVTSPMYPVAAQDPVSYFLTRINNLRASKGLGPLQLNAQLAASAQGHSVYLANHAYNDPHIEADGSSPQSRASAQGYRGRVGENVVGGGMATLDWGFNWWVNSPIHLANMLSQYWTEIGIGAATGTFGTWYTLDFGDSAAAAPAVAQPQPTTGGSQPVKAANSTAAPLPTRPRPTRTPTLTFTPSLTPTLTVSYTPRFTFTPTYTLTPLPPTPTAIYLQVSPQAPAADPSPSAVAVAAVPTDPPGPTAVPPAADSPSASPNAFHTLIPLLLGLQVVIIGGLILGAVLRRRA